MGLSEPLLHYLNTLYREFLILIFRFIVLILIQLFVINNINLSSLCNPYIYIFFILLLPVNIEPWKLLLWSFAIGYIMDLFTYNMGMHSASTVLMGFLRIYFLRSTTTKEDQDKNVEPTVVNKGLSWFLIYAFIMVLVHHTALFFIEAATFTEFFRTLVRVIISATMSVFMIVIGQYLFLRVKER